MDDLLEKMRQLGSAVCVGGQNPYLSVMLYHQAEIALGNKDYDTCASLCERSLAASPVDSPFSWIFHPALPARYERMHCYCLLKSRRTREPGEEANESYAGKARELALREAAGSYEIAKALYPAASILRTKDASGKITEFPSIWHAF